LIREIQRVYVFMAVAAVASRNQQPIRWLIKIDTVDCRLFSLHDHIRSDEED
jgi:hypothetical protein